MKNSVYLTWAKRQAAARYNLANIGWGIQFFNEVTPANQRHTLICRIYVALGKRRRSVEDDRRASRRVSGERHAYSTAACYH
jgi:hypothetical protein